MASAANRLEIRVLGGLSVALDGPPGVSLATRRAEALLAYLAYTGRAHPRLTLADLFWDDRTTAQALGNLRVVLADLRRHAGQHLLITRQTVQFNPQAGAWLDAAEVEAALAELRRQQAQSPNLPRAAAQALEAGLEHFRGDLLAGVALRGASGFGEWVAAERDHLRQRVIGGLLALAGFYLGTGEYAEGVRHARRAIELDPLREAPHRLLMELLARSGQMAAALAQYDVLCEQLQAELGAAPAPETQALHERLAAAGRGYRHNLAAQPTPLVGRALELSEVAARLADPHCRLLTLLGPGGVGKTRLALQAAADRLGDFFDGVYFVPLAPLAGAAGLPAAIAETLRLAFEGRAEPLKQLADHLRPKEVLLVLDNFEHLGAEGADVASTLLGAAPGLKLLVTSRERLAVPGEWLLDVRGLSLPPADDAPAAAQYDAVQLFAQTARRVRPDFALDAASLPVVARLCRLLDGLPLSLELAAAWLRALEVDAIVREIERGLKLLAEPAHTPAGGLPERHAGLRAVFDASWERLAESEQSAFARLCVLRGGFVRAAAREVAGVPLPLLAVLVDRSFITALPGGRYLIHEYLRQFGEERLRAAPEAWAATRDRHSDYFAGFIEAQQAGLRGDGQMRALDSIAAEFENLRRAWRWAVERRHVATLARAVEGLSIFIQIRGRYREGDELFGAAVEALAAPRDDGERRLLGQVLARQARCLEYLWDIERAAALYRRSLDELRAVGAATETAVPLHGLGSLALQQGELAQAAAHLEAALEAARQGDQYGIMASALNTHAQVAERQGDYARARALCEAGLALRRQAQNLQGVTASLNYLGLIMIRQGDYAAAAPVLDEAIAVARGLNYRVGEANALTNRASAAYYLHDLALAERFTRESLAVCRDVGDAWGEAIALNNLGYMAMERGALGEARQQYARSLDIYRRIGIKSGLASTLANLGAACLDDGDDTAARGHLLEALAVAREGGARPIMLKALLGYARWLERAGHPDRARPLLALVARHPSTEQSIRARAEALLGRAAAEPPPLADPEAALAAAVAGILDM